MNDTLKVGIAGYGVVGKRRHVFIDKHECLETVATCDRVFSDKGVSDDGVRQYTNYQDLLDEDLDMLFVCMTNDIAPEVTIAGLEGGLHVFCEKPPGRDLEDIARVISCERQNPDLKLKYGFNHRYHASVRDAFDIIKKGELGPVVNMRGVYGKSQLLSFDPASPDSDWRTQRALSGGGILLDQGIHMVDMMRLFAGEFVEVYSLVSNNYWNHDVEDNAYALMRTDDGVVAMLHSSATEWRHRFRLEITLRHGMIVLSGILSGSKSYGAETMTVVYADKNDRGDPREVTTRYDQDDSWRDEVSEFADAVMSGKSIVNGSSREALLTMQLVYRIYCADQEWRDKYNLTSVV